MRYSLCDHHAVSPFLLFTAFGSSPLVCFFVTGNPRLMCYMGNELYNQIMLSFDAFEGMLVVGSGYVETIICSLLLTSSIFVSLQGKIKLLELEKREIIGERSYSITLCLSLHFFF